MPPVIVGLRNPGPGYEGTRHNVGAEVVGLVARRSGSEFRKARLGIRAEVAEIGHGDERAVLALPRTFMNESGQAVAPLLRYYRAPLADLLVVHDDIDLPFGRLRYQFGRGSGGNNGVDSIISSLRSNEFWRLKFGVGRPPGRMDPADFVLHRFSATERSEIDLLLEVAADSLETYLRDGPEAARQRAGEATGKGQE
jgi:PTH1 family peptidyl-tRNA hydrolase